jgi:hypothetical protein
MFQHGSLLSLSIANHQLSVQPRLHCLVGVSAKLDFGSVDF